MEKQTINQYIKGLEYDSRELLSTTNPKSQTSLPGKSTNTNSVIICTNTPKKISKDIGEISLLSPSNGVIYPGALIIANRSLAEGKPKALTLSRAPINVRVDLPGLGKNGIKTIEDPKNSNVEMEINNMVEYWQENVLPKGSDHAAKVSYTTTKAYSESQLSLDLGFNADWADNNIKNHFKFEKKESQSTTVALFRQIFYTATIDLPSTPADVFKNSVTLKDVQNSVSQDNPPAYVKSVDYGRMVMVRMDTHTSATKADLEQTLNFVTSSGGNISADNKTKYESLATYSQFSVLVIGGGAKLSSQVFQGDSFEKVKEVINKGIQLGKDNPATPISYTVHFLKDHQFAVMPITTEYVETECVEHTSGFIELKQVGMYVGKWEVVWSEYKEDGKTVKKSFKSGNKTSPYNKTISLPGDAHNIRIKAYAATGLVWDPWREAINITESGPTNSRYEIGGTTLNPTHKKYKNL